MIITWKDIKQTVYNMMFLDEGEYNEYSSQIITAANYALAELSEHFSLNGIYEINQAPMFETGYNKYDLKELTKDEDLYIFKGFDDISPVMKITEHGYQAVMDFNISNDRYLYLNKQDKGAFIVNYKKYPTKITNTTSDSWEIELEPEVINMIPLIMAWRIFIDDDITRATMYYNEYQTAKEQLMRKTSFKGGIDIWGGVEF